MFTIAGGIVLGFFASATILIFWRWILALMMIPVMIGIGLIAISLVPHITESTPPALKMVLVLPIFALVIGGLGYWILTNVYLATVALFERRGACFGLLIIFEPPRVYRRVICSFFRRPYRCLSKQLCAGFMRRL
ncbi:MAG: hypothetical protein GW905_13335 [Rhodobacterales bacterium]|nr:hypothetical protein [Rhodobacterales bacterium]